MCMYRPQACIVCEAGRPVQARRLAVSLEMQPGWCLVVAGAFMRTFARSVLRVAVRASWAYNAPGRQKLFLNLLLGIPTTPFPAVPAHPIQDDGYAHWLSNAKSSSAVRYIEGECSRRLPSYCVLQLIV
jgi:hypothetical protein